MKIYLINDEQLLEGVVGSLIMPLLIVFFRYLEGMTFVYSSILAFLFTWIARKLAINNYILYKKIRGYKIIKYELDI
jgi:hypothetical protein